MEIHIILRPKQKPIERNIRKAGCIQFSKYFGPDLKAIGTATIYWKQQYVHARAERSHSIVTIDIPPTEIARLLSHGFSLEVLLNNQPIYYCEWNASPSLARGFYLRVNIESIQIRNPPGRDHLPLATVFTRHSGHYPTREEISYRE